MPYLLDTHTFIWFLEGDKQLSKNIQKILIDTSKGCCISIASIWEIAIKQSLNKLKLNGSFDKIQTFLFKNDIQLLPIKFAHLQKLTTLEFHHRDPFDRIIIAQALAENFTIIAKDDIFKNYKPLKIVW